MSPTLHRFFVPGPLAAGSTVALPPDRARQVFRVLRLRAGDPVILFNGDGLEVPGRLATVAADAVAVTLDLRRPGRTEPPLAVTLAQAVLKSDRFDWVVEKATELGVARILPLLTERTVVSLPDGHATARVARWTRLAAEAAEQSGRVTVPEIGKPRRLRDLQDEISRQPAILCWEGETLATLERTLTVDTGPLLLIVGPEGGFTDREVRWLADAGTQATSLSPLILRSETAAVAGLAAVLALAAARRSEGTTPAQGGEAS